MARTNPLCFPKHDDAWDMARYTESYGPTLGQPTRRESPL